MTNIFQQKSVIYIAEFVLDYEKFIEIEEELNSEFATVTSFQNTEDLWIIRLYLTIQEEEKLKSQLERILGSNFSNITISKLDDKDWVEESQKYYEPIEANDFFIRSTYYSGKIPEDKIDIYINPGRAFGNGEHETTFGCLNEISELGKFLNPKKILDMGTGSGILAIASRFCEGN